MEVLVSFAEFFHGRDRWQACARWCERAITVAKTLPNQPAAASSALPRVEMAGPSGSRKGAEGEAAAMLLASLLTLRGIGVAFGCLSLLCVVLLVALLTCGC